MDNSEINLFKQKVLKWANQFNVCCCLDSNGYKDPYSAYDYLIAAGSAHEINCKSGHAFLQLETFYQLHRDWIFGLLNYDLKNELEQLDSKNKDHLNFPELYFFVPQYLIAIQGTTIKILKGNSSILEIIEQVIPDKPLPEPKLTIERRFTREAYIETIQQLQNHIARGDIYEINFCQEFFARHAHINPADVYTKLNALSPAPFSGFFKINQQYILSASPERFLCKRGEQLISQPIKGTAKRSKHKDEDDLLKNELRLSPKEQAENVMIVDLVRNDLTKSAQQGSVKVDELFGVYSFPQVHQLISTITCTLKPGLALAEAISQTFPMGSMTGAPKIRAMQLIEQYELSKRGAYSGSFGYIDPAGDFDFNVIIRSILYNASESYLSFQVGSAITYAADAETEYEECLLKAAAMIKILGGLVT